MTWIIAGATIAAVLAIYLRLLRGQLDGVQASIRHPKGWLPETARIDEALAVADRHLASARAGANVRLQYGKRGCLTLIRQNPRNGAPGFLARWEFWKPDEALARRLMDLPAADFDHPKRDVLELVFKDDYLSFRNAIRDAFESRDILPGEMHLTWNC